MRLVLWNCNMAFHAKYSSLVDLTPDIAIICECANTEILERRAPAFQPTSAVWIGDNANKGLSIFTFGSFTAVKSECFVDECPYILPVHIDGPARINLLAVWACHSKVASYRDGLGPLRRSLDLYRGFLEEHPTIVAGDFNDNVRWDKPKRPNNHGSNVKELSKLGLVSSYHYCRREKHGAEREPTIYWRDRKIDGPSYHIDYCFIPDSWTGILSPVVLGKFEDWVASGRSDHVPMIVDLAI